MFFNRWFKEKDSPEKEFQSERKPFAASMASANPAASALLSASEFDHEDAERSTAAIEHAYAVFGEVVTLLMRTPQYKDLALSDLEWLVVPPLLSGQVSVATAQSKIKGTTTPAGAILWARVSTDVANRLAAQPGEPIRLAPTKWTSGDIVWVAASAGDGRVLSEMLKRLSAREWAGEEVRIIVHGKNGKPTVATLVRSAEAA